MFCSIVIVWTIYQLFRAKESPSAATANTQLCSAPHFTTYFTTHYTTHYSTHCTTLHFLPHCTELKGRGSDIKPISLQCSLTQRPHFSVQKCRSAMRNVPPNPSQKQQTFSKLPFVNTTPSWAFLGKFVNMFRQLSQFNALFYSMDRFQKENVIVWISNQNSLFCKYILVPRQPKWKIASHLIKSRSAAQFDWAVQQFSIWLSCATLLNLIEKCCSIWSVAVNGDRTNRLPWDRLSTLPTDS